MPDRSADTPGEDGLTGTVRPQETPPGITDRRNEL